MITPLGFSVNEQIWWGASNLSDEYNETLCQIAREQSETEQRNKVGGLETDNYLKNPELIDKLRPLHEMWREAVDYAHGLENSKKDKLWGFKEIWSHISSNTHGHYQPHHHGNLFWSGVYYPKAPKGSGKISFYGHSKWLGNTETAIRWFIPEPGLWIIFPPDLLHWTDPNEENVERICFAFNSVTTGGVHMPPTAEFY